MFVLFMMVAIMMLMMAVVMMMGVVLLTAARLRFVMMMVCHCLTFNVENKTSGFIQMSGAKVRQEKCNPVANSP